MRSDLSTIDRLIDKVSLIATHAFLPIVSTLPRQDGSRVEQSVILVAASLLGKFPEYVRPEQRVPDPLAEPGRKTLEFDVNPSKLPTISAPVPRQLAAFEESEDEGYKIPDNFDMSKTDEEKP